MMKVWIENIYKRLTEHKKVASKCLANQQKLDILLQIFGTLTLGISLVGLGISLVTDTTTLSKTMNSMVVGFNLGFVILNSINKAKEYGKNAETHFNSYKNYLDWITDADAYSSGKFINTDEECFIYLKSRLDHLLLDAPLLKNVENGMFQGYSDLEDV